MTTAVIAFTRRGAALGRSLADALGGTLHVPARFAPEAVAEAYSSLEGWTAWAWARADALVFVGAAGIAVRAIAPHVRDKFSDPAVVSVDEAGRFVVPLLSGHVGGANELARRVAALTGGQAVVSTATDVNGLFAVDVWARERGMAITDRVLAKEVSAALLEGRPVGFASDFGHPCPEGLTTGPAELGVWITDRTGEGPFPRTLRLVPRSLILGIGCRRGTPEAAIEAAAAAALAELGRKGSPGAFLRAISRHKTGADGGDDPAFALYQEKLEGKLDFDDLLLETLRQWEGGRSDRRFTHLLVDEFQDIDRLQLRLLRAWRREGGTFFAIGDPDQSIYGFRGADAGCFSALGAERTVRLTENYRSTPEILAAALPVAEAIDGAPRRMETHSPHGAEVRLLTDEGDRAEAIFVAKEIARMVGGIGMLEAQALGAARGARSFGDIAVLYRTRRQAALLEECLAHDGIPCVVTGREDFLLDGEVQAALAWLEGQQEEGNSPAALLEEWTAHHTPSGGVERLRNMAVFFGDVPAFLRNLTIGQEGDLLRRAGLSYAAGAVTLSTLHGAKGLEWPVVFLCGVGEGRIPLERKGLDTDEAEERRLLYVGMTRAREELVLLSGGEPSRFLAGLPLRQDTAHAPVPRPLGVQLSLFK